MSGAPSSRPSSVSLHSNGSGQFPRREKRSVPSESDDEPTREVSHVDFFLDNHLPSSYFKEDVLNLIHSLMISQWKRVDRSMAKDIIVGRISGALTNAVYGVEPPPYLKDDIKKKHNSEPHTRSYHYKVPQKLLLRVYGPQVAHLIDREAELATLARLSARKIGPRLYGTFNNGRFEQFLNARPLTRLELRSSEVSAQIARRMRELHDGVLLLDHEREKGPLCWQNIKKWTNRVTEVLKILDASHEIHHTSNSILQGTMDDFLRMIDIHRKYLEDKYGKEQIKKELVFAHNDTQYGNILRIEPPKGSPLLYPQNEHRQLVVIDFEYSGANARGFDIANHFCEWMSDYNDEREPFHAHNEWFPTYEERLDLITSYVEHGYSTFDDEEAMERDIKSLLEQSTDWRPAVSAAWCMWGIVQAVIDEQADMNIRESVDTASGFYRFETEVQEKENVSDDSPLSLSTLKNVQPIAEDIETIADDSFDYLSYAAEKAQLFWTDMIRLGLLKAEDYHGIVKSVNVNKTGVQEVFSSI